MSHAEQFKIAHKEIFPICQRLQRERGFSGVNPEHVNQILPHYKDHVLAAVAYADGEFSWGDIVERLVDTSWQLWITPKSCCITKIREQAQYDECVLLYAGGDMDDMKACIEGIMEWARVNGCERLRIEGRKGWGEVFADLGAQLKYHVYSIDLGD